MFESFCPVQYFHSCVCLYSPLAFTTLVVFGSSSCLFGRVHVKCCILVHMYSYLVPHFRNCVANQTLHFCSSTLHNKVVFIVGLSSIMLSLRLSILLFRFSNCYHPWVSQAPFRLCGFSSGDSPSPVSIRFRMLIRYSINLSSCNVEKSVGKRAIALPSGVVR